MSVRPGVEYLLFFRWLCKLLFNALLVFAYANSRARGGDKIPFGPWVKYAAPAGRGKYFDGVPSEHEGPLGFRRG